MDAIRGLIDRLVEIFKEAAASQQESKLVIAIREKYQELSPLGQRITLWTTISIVTMMVLYIPASNLMEAWDLSSNFNERRQMLRELLKVVKDSAGAPSMRPTPGESQLKSQIDSQLSAAGVRPEQIKSQPGQVPREFAKLNTSQIGYQLERVTIKQAMDVVFTIEQNDPATKVIDFSLTADTKDPHYYQSKLQVVSFGPRVADAGTLSEAIKNGPGKKPGTGR